MAHAAHGHPSSFQGMQGTKSLSLELDVEKRLQAFVAKDGIRIRQFFIDFDKLRKGTCGDAAFRTCLGTLQVKLDQQEIDALINKYKTGVANLVNYDAFCKNIDKVFSDECSDQKGVILGAQSGAQFTDYEKDCLMAQVNSMCSLIKAHRILLKPAFQDFDRAQSLHVTAQQFLRVLKQLGLMPPSQDDYDLLIRRYCDKGSTAEVNYYRFCRDLDNPKDIFPDYVAKRPENGVERKYFAGTRADQKTSFFKEDTAEIDVIANRW